MYYQLWILSIQVMSGPCSGYARTVEPTSGHIGTRFSCLFFCIEAVHFLCRGYKCPLYCIQKQAVKGRPQTVSFDLEVTLLFLRWQIVHTLANVTSICCVMTASNDVRHARHLQKSMNHHPLCCPLEKTMLCGRKHWATYNTFVTST